MATRLWDDENLVATMKSMVEYGWKCAAINQTLSATVDGAESIMREVIEKKKTNESALHDACNHEDDYCVWGG